MSRFCLISEGWIPCLFPDGQLRELGLLETLSRAPEIVEISDPSPPVVASLHRLLLAILHRNLGPANSTAWKALWQAGRFDSPVLEQYLRQWEHRFDLFDTERPFYQVAVMGGGVRVASVADIAIERCAGNNPTLFDHPPQAAPEALSAAHAARLLVACQSYARSGTYAREIGGGADAGVGAGLLRGGAVVLVRGESLAQTLLLNLVPYSPADERPFACTGEDLPCWEAPREAEAGARDPVGYLDYLTWQSKRVLLSPEESTNGSIRVTGVQIARGRELDTVGILDGPHEQMMVRLKPAKGDKPWFALRLDPVRALWRDSMSLFGIAGSATAGTEACRYLAMMCVEAPSLWGARLCLDVCGIWYEPTKAAKVEMWRHERQPLPVAYLSDAALVERLSACLEAAETAGSALRTALWVLAEQLISTGDRAPDRKAVRAVYDRLGGDAAYWSQLEPLFSHLALALAGRQGQEERLAAGWLDDVLLIARRSLDGAADRLHADARALRATTAATRLLSSRLRRLAPDPLEVNDAATQ